MRLRLTTTTTSLLSSSQSITSTSSSSSSLQHHVSSSINCSNRSVFTYSFGRSSSSSNAIYVPLTCRSNTRTKLPQSRGPNFRMPPDVVAALCRVRDAEAESVLSASAKTKVRRKWEPWCRWLDTQANEDKQKLPHYPYEPVCELLEEYDGIVDDDDCRRPSVKELLEEIEPELCTPTQIIFAGEGEPLLRLKTLLRLSKRIKNHRNNNDNNVVSIRVITNGLAGPQVPELLYREGGIDVVTVALMTHDPVQYEEIMMMGEPDNPTGTSGCRDSAAATTTTSSSFSKVCDFIRSASSTYGLSVEITAVDRPDVDKMQTEKLASELLGLVVGDDGNTTPPTFDSVIRWRPYFP